MSFFIAEAFFFHHIEPVRTEQTEKNIRARQVAEMREEMRVQELKRLQEEETRLREEHMESERLAYETEKDIQEAIRVKEEMDNLEAQEAARKELLAQALLNLKEKEEADIIEIEKNEKKRIEKEKFELEEKERVYRMSFYLKKDHFNFILNFMISNSRFLLVSRNTDSISRYSKDFDFNFSSTVSIFRAKLSKS